MKYFVNKNEAEINQLSEYTVDAQKPKFVELSATQDFWNLKISGRLSKLILRPCEHIRNHISQP